jgi:hypothetical protein
MNDRELLWKQYELNINLTRSYLELALKLNLFYYAITGAILSFYFTHPEEPLIRFSLALPVLMSVAFSGLFVYGAWISRYTRDEIFRIRDSLRLQVAPEVRVLAVFLYILAAIFFFVAVALAWMILCR